MEVFDLAPNKNEPDTQFKSFLKQPQITRSEYGSEIAKEDAFDKFGNYDDREEMQQDPDNKNALGVNYKVKDNKGNYHILKVINTKFFEQFSQLFIETFPFML